MIFDGVAATVDFEVALSDDTIGPLTLQCRRPTYAEQLRDMGHATASYFADDPATERQRQAEDRLRAVVVGWAGVVNAAGEPVPFDWTRFMAACGRYPAVLGLAVDAANRAFAGASVDELAKKN